MAGGTASGSPTAGHASPAACTSTFYADHLVESGGELRVSGVKPDGSPRWFALEGHGAPETVVALHGLSVATSGEYRRAFTYAERRFGHTLDARRAAPLEIGLHAVSVPMSTPPRSWPSGRSTAPPLPRSGTGGPLRARCAQWP